MQLTWNFYSSFLRIQNSFDFVAEDMYVTCKYILLKKLKVETVFQL